MALAVLRVRQPAADPRHLLLEGLPAPMRRHHLQRGARRRGHARVRHVDLSAGSRLQVAPALAVAARLGVLVDERRLHKVLLHARAHPRRRRA
eukprot:4868387-Prymnesium_polylepis.1